MRVDRHNIVGPMSNVIPVLERIIPKVDTSGECWLWTGAKGDGYGIVWDQRLGRNRHVTRVVYELAHRVNLPDDIGVLHTCDNPPCVRPSHLFTGTQLDNMRDARRKDRVRKGEAIAWASLTEATVREIRTRYAAGERQMALAREYGVGQTSISDVVRRRTWAHVE